MVPIDNILKLAENLTDVTRMHALVISARGRFSGTLHAVLIYII